MYVLPEEQLPLPPRGSRAATKLQWTPIKEEKVRPTRFKVPSGPKSFLFEEAVVRVSCLGLLPAQIAGTLFEGLLDRYEEAESSPAALDVSAADSASSSALEIKTFGVKDQEAGAPEPRDSVESSAPASSASRGALSLSREQSLPAADSEWGGLRKTVVDGGPSGSALANSFRIAGGAEGGRSLASLRVVTDAKSGGGDLDSGGGPPLLRKATFHYRVDYERVFSLFYNDEQELRAKTQRDTTGGAGAGKAKLKGVLESKAAQNVEICLKKYKLATVADFEGLGRQLQQPMTAEVDSTLAQNLVLYWPDGDQEKRLVDLLAQQQLQRGSEETSADSPLLPAADTMYAVLCRDVPLCQDRLKFLLQ